MLIPAKIRLDRRRATSTPAGLSLFSDAIRPRATRAERAKKTFSAALPEPEYADWDFEIKDIDDF